MAKALAVDPWQSFRDRVNDIKQLDISETGEVEKVVRFLKQEAKGVTEIVTMFKRRHFKDDADQDTLDDIQKHILVAIHRCEILWIIIKEDWGCAEKLMAVRNHTFEAWVKGYTFALLSREDSGVERKAYHLNEIIAETQHAREGVSSLEEAIPGIEHPYRVQVSNSLKKLRFLSEMIAALLKKFKKQISAEYEDIAIMLRNEHSTRNEGSVRSAGLTQGHSYPKI